MIVNEKVGLIGIGITPTSLAIAPSVTEARIPTLVLSSGNSVTVTQPNSACIDHLIAGRVCF